MPYSHLLAHVLAHHLGIRFVPNARIRLVLLGIVSAVLLILWFFYHNENAWRGFEVACAPVVEALCHIGSHEGAEVAADVAEEVAHV
jgi:hypothetical protein